MKRRVGPAPVYGTLEDGKGRKVLVREPVVAQALSEAQANVQAIADALANIEAELMQLRRHWWVRAGRALRLVRDRRTDGVAQANA